MDPNRNDGHKTKVQVAIQPNIGLDSDTRHSVVEILNTTLADEAVLTLKTRSAYWNMRGPGFFDLHILFNTQYELLNQSSNEIAERTRMMGGNAIGNFKEFIQHARMDEQPGVVPDVLRLLADHESSIRHLRDDAKKCSEEFEDEGTSELLVKVMQQHEKMAWILRSFKENGTIPGEITEMVVIA